MARASQMTIEQIEGVLREKGWTVEEDYAEIEVDLSRSITDGDFSYLYPDGYYPEIFNENTYATYELDLESRHAKFYLYDGERVGTEAPEDDDFDGVVDMDVREVGSMPLARLVEGTEHPNYPQYNFFDLMLVERDWGCDLYGVAAGEYLIRSQSNRNVRPRDGSAYYRVSEETAREIMALDAVDAYSRMEEIAEQMEEEERV